MAWRNFGIALLGALAVLSVYGAPHRAKSGACKGQIIYLSDTDNAYKYLEAEQKAVYDANPGEVDPFLKEQLRSPRSISNFAELNQRVLSACPDPAQSDRCAVDPRLVDRLIQEASCLEVPTHYESPLFFAVMQHDFEQLEKLRQKFHPSAPQARFGTLPTGAIDGQAYLPPKSKLPITILDRHLYILTGVLSTAVSDALSFEASPDNPQGRVLDYEPEDIRKRLHDHPYIVQNFADAVTRLARDGSPAGAPAQTLDNDHYGLQARLNGSMLMFLLAHEEAHVFLNHVSDDAVPFKLTGSRRTAPALPATQPQGTVADSGSEPSVLMTQRHTRLQEMAADSRGYALMIYAQADAGSDDEDEAVAAAAPHTLFRLLDAADAYGRESGGYRFNDENHPNMAVRDMALSLVYDKMAEQLETLKKSDFRVVFDAALTELLAEADPIIRENLQLPPKDGTPANPAQRAP